MTRRRDGDPAVTPCNQGILLPGNGHVSWPRWCHLPAGHEGQHETMYLREVIKFDTPERAA